jgi:hypothetical protein
VFMLKCEHDDLKFVASGSWRFRANLKLYLVAKRFFLRVDFVFVETLSSMIFYLEETLSLDCFEYRGLWPLGFSQFVFISEDLEDPLIIMSIYCESLR